MTKKRTIKDRKDISIKFNEDYTIDGVKYEKGSEHKISINDIEDKELDLKHKEEIKDTIEGKLKLTKAKNETEEPKEVTVKIKGKFDNGYFWDSLEIEELENTANTAESYKIETKGVRIGADLLGVNYWGWGGILLLLVALGTLGYYWWNSYSKEEEEENI